MARIDFHSNVSDKLEYVCRLTRKIWSATPEGQPVRNIVIVAIVRISKSWTNCFGLLVVLISCHIALLQMRLLQIRLLYSQKTLL